MEGIFHSAQSAASCLLLVFSLLAVLIKLGGQHARVQGYVIVISNVSALRQRPVLDSTQESMGLRGADPCVLTSCLPS